jgi:hypothetical protein
VRTALERAWFENAPLRIRYAGPELTTVRRIRIRTVVMERSETLLNVIDLDKNAPRQFRLQHIEHAEVLPHTDE